MNKITCWRCILPFLVFCVRDIGLRFKVFSTRYKFCLRWNNSTLWMILIWALSRKRIGCHSPCFLIKLCFGFSFYTRANSDGICSIPLLFKLVMYLCVLNSRNCSNTRFIFCRDRHLDCIKQIKTTSFSLSLAKTPICELLKGFHFSCLWLSFSASHIIFVI